MSIHDDIRASAERIHDDAYEAEFARLREETQVWIDRTRDAEAVASAQSARAATAEAEVVQKDATITDLSAEITDLTARLAACEAGPDPEPEPEPVKVTLFGSCPVYPGGESVNAARTVTTKWGDNAAVRQFKGDFSAPNQVGSITHTSYKPNIDDLLAGRLDAEIATVVNGARDGDVLEVWHEADKKVTDGVDTYARLVAAKNYFYDKVKAINPEVLVANTVTGWLFEPTRNPAPDWRRWGAVKADIIGVDCDGIHPTKLPYTDYTGETERARAFIQEFAANGYRFYAVPEYGSNRIPGDTDGVDRAKAYTRHGEMWAADPLCLFVTAYEYDPSSSYTYRLTTPAEIAAWKSLIPALPVE